MDPGNFHQQREAAPDFRLQNPQTSFHRDEKPPAQGMPFFVDQYGADGRFRRDDGSNFTCQYRPQVQREMVPQMQAQHASGQYRAFESQNMTHATARQQSHGNHQQLARLEAQRLVPLQPMQACSGQYGDFQSQRVNHSATQQQSYYSRQHLAQLEAQRRQALLLMPLVQGYSGDYASRLDNQSLQVQDPISSRCQREDALFRSDQRPTHDLHHPLPARAPSQTKPEPITNVTLVEDEDDKVEEQTVDEAFEFLDGAVDSSYSPRKQTYAR